MKEFERTKLQLDQLQSYKREAQERMKELKDKLQHQENELKDTKEKFNTYRDEMTEVTVLRNTVRLLKDELWHLKMNRASSELAKLESPQSATKTNEIADIYKDSALLLNDLFSSIASYKITGENVAAKQEIIRSKMKLVDQTAFNLNNRLNQCQSNILPGSIIQTTMKTFSNPQFSKSLVQDRQLAAEIRLPGDSGGGGSELDLTQDQYRLIMREVIGCV